MLPQSLALPAVALCLFWWVLPVSLDRRSAGISNEQCLTLSDSQPSETTSIAALQRCSALVPGDTELKGDLADAYERAGQFTEAEAAYRQVLLLDPDYADVRLRLGRLLLRRGATDDARRHAQLALRVQPNRLDLLKLLSESAAKPAADRSP